MFFLTTNRSDKNNVFVQKNRQSQKQKIIKKKQTNKQTKSKRLQQN